MLRYLGLKITGLRKRRGMFKKLYELGVPPCKAHELKMDIHELVLNKLGSIKAFYALQEMNKDISEAYKPKDEVAV